MLDVLIKWLLLKIEEVEKEDYVPDKIRKFSGMVIEKLEIRKKRKILV